MEISEVPDQSDQPDVLNLVVLKIVKIYELYAVELWNQSDICFFLFNHFLYYNIRL